MGLNDTPSGERVHVGFFGLRNAGKSSLVNAVTGQKLSLVSEVKGTTTDPVKKAMELLPLGPVVIIDTPGIDDTGELGRERVLRAEDMLSETDVAVLAVDASLGLTDPDRDLIKRFEARGIPYVIAYNKSDLPDARMPDDGHGLTVSALTGAGIGELKERIARLGRREAEAEKHIAADLLKPGECAVLVIPIDAAAPKGRLILPQQQTIRDLLEGGCSVVCCRDTELSSALEALSAPPSLVITDSQAFGRVAKIVPRDVRLTSFSILFARYKGDLAELVKGAAALSKIRDGDPVLISEGCSHHRQCGDIGTEKLPRWIREFTGAEPAISFTSGGEFPEDLTPWKLVVHCGGCMLNEREMKSRIARAAETGVPVVNYGVAIAHIHGILRRSLEVFPEALNLLDGKG
ncbi:MAG: [FeFe] hydrogenase H-cluster maturation GTPase HydF [Ruminococcaceae bacterium]|jgi:[FeFe] hydrogenase H-cluster maturation GTPase HydF|nr:[FeFe] hydrogenase H-cluster maturation GTPase HydF [Oscillospiraceae bacterium]